MLNIFLFVDSTAKLTRYFWTNMRSAAKSLQHFASTVVSIMLCQC
jgi:hypothetical protein